MEDADGLSFDFKGGLDSGPVQPTASSVPVVLPENSSSAAVNVAPNYDHSAATVVGAGKGRSFRQTVYRNWLRCLCVKYRDDEKDRCCSSSSKFDSIPLQSKERDRNTEKATSSSNLDSIPLQAKERDRNTEKATSSSNLDSIPLQAKERDCNTEKATSSSKIDPLPLDLEIEILTRLPAKALLKFRCVSKIWSSIIQSQTFVDSFFSMSSMTQSRFIIAFTNFGRSVQSQDKRLFIFSSSHEGRESSSLATTLHMTIPSVTMYSNSATVCASVHGFLGITAHNPFIICNPITGKLTNIPGSRTSLGYDPVGDQFKALTLVSDTYRAHDFLVHEVLTHGGGGESSWRRNQVNSPPYKSLTKAICINGFVYFGAWTPTRDENPVIVTFDVRFESISFIRAPLDVVYWEGESILIEYKGLGTTMTCPGINKAGEFIFALKNLPRDVQPYYIFYYNVDRNDMRKVMLKGIADDEEFRRRYRISDACCVHISPNHVESIASL
ncbi:hypothetical protein CARUB_v10012262mg [Capsella rubella]|uniref:F-box domain-containing protein n=1 Tax=Capsella rubella TaxID=81985 RepID=R0IPY5_9BRAS|nr:hypothetical protein CARUB_v10012262mg [Capsella rubella]